MKGSIIHWALIRLLMLIFLYSAASKVLDFSTSSSELGKSPFLHNMAGFMSYAVPGVEAVVAILLLVQKARRVTLYVYLYMMTAFLGYVYLMMEKAYYLPCACMGLFDSLGWGEHLTINGIITAIVVVTILLDKGKSTDRAQNLELSDFKINPVRL